MESITLKSKDMEPRHEFINTDFVCVQLKVDNAEDLKNSKAMKAAQCILSTSTVQEGIDSKANFLDCMSVQGIALNDPAVTKIIKYATAEECFGRSLPVTPSIKDVRKLTTQRILCFTYVSNAAVWTSNVHRFLCKLPKDVQLDENDDDALINYYRYV